MLSFPLSLLLKRCCTEHACRTIIFSAIRLRSLHAINFADFSFTILPVMTWTTAEVGVTIMVASSALLRPVFDKLFHRMLSLSGSSRHHPLGPSNQYSKSPSNKVGSSRVHMNDHVTAGRR